MKNWKSSRNYRRFKNDDGDSTVNIIWADGEAAEVSDDVFNAYSKIERRERYIEEDRVDKKPLSLDTLSIQAFYKEQTLAVPSAEEMYVARERSQVLATALDSLSAEDRRLIEAIYVDKTSQRDYARTRNKVQSTIEKRLQRILRYLKKMMHKAGF